MIINNLYSQKYDKNVPINSNGVILDFFASLRNFQPMILCVALFFFIYIPIISLIPFLLYLQINESLSVNKKSKLVNIYDSKKHKKPLKWDTIVILIICVLVLSIYNSTIFVYSDTAVYLRWFTDILNLNFSESLDYLRIYNQEPMTLMTIKYIVLFLGFDANSFLLISALFLNSSFIIITYKVVPKYYPIIILINVLSVGYYNQLFYFRQTVSFVFVIMFLFTENKFLSSSLFLLTFNTHSSSLLLFPVLFLKLGSGKFKIIDNFLKSNRIKSILVLILIISLISLILFRTQILNFVLSFISTFGNEPLRRRADLYLRNEGSSFQGGQTFLFLNSFIFIFYILKVDFKNHLNSLKNNPLLYSLIGYFIVLMIGLFVVIFAGFNFRLVYFLTSLNGFFYLIPIISHQIQRKNTQYYLFLSQIILGCGIFIRNLFREHSTDFSLFLQERVGQVTFWEARPLDADLFDYIKHFINVVS